MTAPAAGNDADVVDIWRYRGIDVFYEPDVDGDGRNQAPSFVRYIRERFGDAARFGSVFEWCAGPAFIGFALLAEGIADRLCIADVNPLAVQYAARTARENGLEDRVSLYVSDNMRSVGSEERFDLVVGNPPTFFAINPAHHDYYWLKDDPRANDPGWRIHEDFYDTIGRFLRPSAPLLVQEVEPILREVFTPVSNPVHWDRRPEVPLARFQDMIDRGGLRFQSAEIYHVERLTGVRHWMIESKAAPAQI